MYLNFENKETQKNFDIVEYKKYDESWNYIKKNKELIWDFLNDGYYYAGVGEFCGCVDANHIVTNGNLVKIAFFQSKWVAISIYTGYRGGFKCVGITATTNTRYRKCGVDAVHEIIKHDVCAFEDFFWTECSGSVESIYEKYRGVRIPNVYVESILRRPVESKDEDGFHYVRKINDLKQRKIIYGFNNKQTYEMVMSECRNFVEDRISFLKNRPIVESLNTPFYKRYSKLDLAIDIVNVFYDLRLEEQMYDYPQSSLDELRKSVNFIRKCFFNDSVPCNKINIARDALFNGREILRTSSPMKLIKF